MVAPLVLLSDLDADMTAFKELNKELLSKIEGMVTGFTREDSNVRGDFVRLAAKAKQLLKRLLKRSSQLDQEMKALKIIKSEIVKEGLVDGQAGVVDGGEKMEHSPVALKLDSVFRKIESMIKDGDQTGKPSLQERIERSEKEEEDEVEDEEGDEEDEVEEAGDSKNDDRVRVRVTRVKKDGSSIWSEDDDEDLIGDNAEDTSVEARIRKATKKMEEMMKEHLKNSGISTAGQLHASVISVGVTLASVLE